VLCSPSSLTRPWINFEAGWGWGWKRISVVPICHSGQKKDRLPFPFCELQALQLEDSKFPKDLVDALCRHFHIHPRPVVANPEGCCRQLELARKKVRPSGAAPQVICSVLERTNLIINDLSLLLKKGEKNETVWTSAFLSAFAIANLLGFLHPR